MEVEKIEKIRSLVDSGMRVPEACKQNGVTIGAYYSARAHVASKKKRTWTKPTTTKAPLAKTPPTAKHEAEGEVPMRAYFFQGTPRQVVEALRSL